MECVCVCLYSLFAGNVAYARCHAWLACNCSSQCPYRAQAADAHPTTRRLPNALVDVPPCKRQNWKLRTLPPMRCDVRPKHDPHYRVPPCSLQRRSNVTQCHQSGAVAVLQEDTRGFSHLNRAGGKENMIARSAHGAWKLNPAQRSMHPWAGFWISR